MAGPEAGAEAASVVGATAAGSSPSVGPSAGDILRSRRSVPSTVHRSSTLSGAYPAFSNSKAYTTSSGVKSTLKTLLSLVVVTSVKSGTSAEVVVTLTAAIGVP